MSREYTTQSYLGALQCLVILAGCAFTALALKVYGSPEARENWPFLPVLIRSWGFLVLVIPLLWVIATIHAERKSSENWTSRHTLLSGLIMLVALTILFIAAISSLSQIITPIKVL